MFSTRLANIIAALGLIVAIYSVWQQARDKTPELTVRIFETGGSRSVAAVKDLSVKYSFKGAEVSGVRVFQLELINSGKATIVGEGNSSNVIGDGMHFEVDGVIRILSISHIAGKLVKSVLPNASNTFTVRFEQLRPDETTRVELIVEGGPSNTMPVIKATQRSLLNGDIRVEVGAEEGEQNKVRPKWLPNWFWTLFRSFAIPTLAIFGGAFLIVFALSLIEFIRLKYWRISNGQLMKKHLQEASAKAETSEAQRRYLLDAEFVDSPWMLFSESIHSYVSTGGQTPPTKTKPIFSNGKQALFIAPLFLMGSLAMMYAAFVITKT
jgi:hypothetical protein